MKKILMIMAVCTALAIPAAAAGRVAPYVAGDPGGGTCFEQYCWVGGQWVPCGYDCH